MSSLFSKNGIYLIISCFLMNEITVAIQNNVDRISENHKQVLAQLPCQALIQGMLEKRIPFHILHIEDEPASILMRSNRIGTILAGQPNVEQLQTILTLLSKYETVALICPQDLQPFFMEHGYRPQRRIAFEFVMQADQVAEPVCPEGYSVQAIDSIDIFKQCSCFSSKSILWGSAENFIKNSFGYVLVNQEGKVVAQAYAAWIGGGFCEIGVATQPEFQGKGFSTILTKYFLHECFRRNLIPLWSCNYGNIASVKVALKSGFNIKNYYAWMVKQKLYGKMKNKLYILF